VLSPSTEPLFPARSERGYDAAAVETFPWPVIAGYEDVHRWMDQGQAVHAVWQLRDVWEDLIKFLATLAAADYLATASDGDPRTSKLLALLLKRPGMSMGDWAKSLEITLKEGPPQQSRIPALSPLLFRRGKPSPLLRLINDGDNGFVRWRNECFGHGVFRKDQGSYAKDALDWLERLHEAFDLCRSMFETLVLETDGPNGEILIWGRHEPLPFYHAHQPAGTAQLLPPVRVRLPGGEALLLTPLLSVQQCDTCNQPAAFYLDKYDPGRHKAKFLDFVQGHCNERKNLEPLRIWTERISEADARAAASRQPDPGERREPDPERFRDFQCEFEPPVYLARQVAGFLKAHDCGVLAITGPGGVGKSWATEGLDHAGMLPAVLGRAVPVLCTSMHGPTAPRANDVWTALAEQTRRVKRWQAPAWPDGPDPHTRFVAWLAALMRVNGIGELIVAFDGLDDLPAESDVPDLWPPAGALAPGCYLVLSSRPHVRAAADKGLARVRSMPDHFGELRIGPNESEHRAVLRSYVTKRLARPRPDGQGPLPAAWVEPLIDQADGSFLYVFHFCQALHYGVYTDLAQLPPPSTYYPAFMDHLRGRVGDELFESQYAKVLALIAVAREPVGLKHLESWGLERSRLIVMLDDLADLLRTRREAWDEETLYSLGHDAIRQFLNEDAAWQTRLASANDWLATLTVQRFGNDWSSVDPFDVVERYLLIHLLDHANGTELNRLLADIQLAKCCLKYGNALWDKNDHAQCLAAYEMALALRKDQVWRQGRRELRNDLATAYMHRGNSLLELGRVEESLGEYEIAVSLCEDLVKEEDDRDLRDDLAYAYLYRGRALGHLGRLEKALSDHAIAIDLYEELVHWDDRNDLRVQLATAYRNRGVFLKQLGRLEEALLDCNSCIELRASDPELRDQLGADYASRGTALADLGRLEEALADYTKAIKLEEHLVLTEGKNELRHSLALSYMNRSVALTDLGRLQEALADCTKSVEIEEDLVQRQGHSELRHSLATAYLNRGRTLGNLGRRNEALADHDACIRLREQLVQREGRGELRDELAHAYMLRACDVCELGRVEESLTDYSKCIRLHEELVRREGRRELRNLMAIAYMNRGMAFAKLGRLEEALADFVTCVDLEEELVHNEGRRDLACQLAWGYAQHAELLLRLGQRELACQRAREAVAMLQIEVAHNGRADLRGVLEMADDVARNACG